jgi:trans-2,3-dihydro-3-hydroxyanthranilate isomerase
VSKAYEYVTVDVFTDRAFAGNPVAVVTDAGGLTGEQMQRVAAEFNYSESTFVLPPEDRAHTAGVRIFTPRDEIPFAGHPNVGTAFAMALLAERRGERLGPRLVFEERAGLVPVDLIMGADGHVLGAMLTAPEPLTLGPVVPPAVVAECAGLEPAAVVTSRHEPVIASVGLPFVIAEVAGDALGRAKPSAGSFAVAAGRFPSRPGRFSLYLYAPTAERTGAAALRARMFAPLSGLLEDPATGSAGGALVALLASLAPEPDTVLELDIQQGVEMGRPSRLTATAEKRGGEIARVRVGGRCVAMMEGTFSV